MASPAKIAAREEIRRRLAEFSLQARRDASEVILGILQARPEWKSASVLGLYLSLPDEPETRDLIRLSWQHGKRVALPKTDIRHGLTWWEIQSGPLPNLDTLWEPLPGKHQAVPPENIEGFCVPGRAFDHLGTRLGRGGGHYDRALGQRSRRAWVTGLFFSLQEMPNLPREEHDAFLPQVVTEQGWRSLL
ncbi:5-formyltetrahydrofolate cyclo-ligase [bacterium]|nr:5-formyltetrahydrofolate cyclo-ligase [bacterium]